MTLRRELYHMYMKCMRKMCAQCVIQEETITHTVWLNKEMLKKFFSLSLYIYIHTCTHACTHTRAHTHIYTHDLAVWSEADCFGGKSDSFTMLFYSA